jgi:hypothetical protein
VTGLTHGGAFVNLMLPGQPGQAAGQATPPTATKTWLQYRVLLDTPAATNLAGVPKAAFIAGRTAPEGKPMGHAGAIISGGSGTAASKVTALEAAGFRVAGSPTELPVLLRDAGYRG